MGKVIDNEERRRFELDAPERTAFATYRRAGDIVTILHVETPPELRGKGEAARLMEGIVALAREQRFRIVAACPYAVAWFRSHPDAGDVLT